MDVIPRWRGLIYGVSDESVQLLIADAAPNGVILDDAEAREFLEWVVAQ